MVSSCRVILDGFMEEFFGVPFLVIGSWLLYMNAKGIDFIHCLVRSNLEDKSGDELLVAFANHKMPEGEFGSERRFLAAGGRGLLVIGAIIFFIGLSVNSFPKPQNLTFGLVLLGAMMYFPKYVLWRTEQHLAKYGVATSYLDRDQEFPINAPVLSFKIIGQQIACTMAHVLYLLLVASLCAGIVNWAIKGISWLSS